ncbi:MAG TPA: molybdopterin cofactor-binding domain-containing protein, partial [Burkholderiales bacterium]|nr:molybdopterin cofactor-binding domain-containing protein [Burkholderiales bacterium]
LSDARRLTQRVHFERDGTVTIASGKVELGQGIVTALAQIAAEELGVPLEKIRVLPASTAHSPDEGVTSGSLSIQDGGKGLRKACAELRALLAKSGKKSYWDLEVAGKDIPAEAPEKPAAEYKVVGTNVPRIELPAKIAGKASYVQDMVLPGMLHARMLRPLRPAGMTAGKLVSLPPAPAGMEILRDGNFAALVGPDEAAVIEAAKKLRAKAQWSDGPALPADIYAWLKGHASENNVQKEVANPEAKAKGVKRLQAEYHKPFICHASIGPSCALAQMKGDTLHVWSHTQGIFGLRQEISMVLRMPEDKIIVHHGEGAGCYGHNGADDAGLDAALLARMAKGRPIRLQWAREDEFAWEPYGPAMVVALDASLDQGGNIVSWRHDLWSNGHTHRPGRSAKPVLIAGGELAQPFERAPAIDPPLPAGGAQRNAVPGYEFPDLLVMQHYVREAPVHGSSLRSLGAFGNVFGIESFMDELAAAANADPVEFRLRHLKDPRGRAVLEEAVRKAGAFSKGEGKGRGVAYARYKNVGAYCAVVVEVEAGGAELRVTRIVAAVDVGLPVNPDGVINQIEGGCVQATSWALKEAWRPGVAGWEDYPILRFSEAPPVEVSILKNTFPSLGAGECTMGPVVAAIANALSDALGVRVRKLPLTAENIANA